MTEKVDLAARVPTTIHQTDIWQKTLENIKRELSEQSFKTWIWPVRFLKHEGDTVWLEVPDKFYRDWLKEHYQDIIRGAFFEAIGLKPNIQYTVVDRSFKSLKDLKRDSPLLKVSSETHGLN